MDIIDKVTYVTPNEHEAVLIFGDELSTENLLKKYPEKLVITQGSRGVSTCLKNGEVLTVTCKKGKCGGYDRSRRYTEWGIFCKNCSR